jgi:hypothetical protein
MLASLNLYKCKTEQILDTGPYILDKTKEGIFFIYPISSIVSPPRTQHEHPRISTLMQIVVIHPGL